MLVVSSTIVKRLAAKTKSRKSQKNLSNAIYLIKIAGYQGRGVSRTRFGAVLPPKTLS